MKTPFVWLGSGRAKKWHVDDKARLLDQAAKAGLPVPPGAVLLDEFFQLVLAEGVIAAENGRYHAPDPQWLAETLFDGIRFPQMDKPVVVRAADASPSPQPGVDFTDPNQLSQSLCEFWSSAPDNGRRDALIMEMVTRGEAGTAVTRHNDKTDHIPPLTLTQLRAWQRPSPKLPAHIRRLQQLLRGVRRTFGKGDWAIDWVDDGRICWLLQIRDWQLEPGD